MCGIISSIDEKQTSDVAGEVSGETMISKDVGGDIFNLGGKTSNKTIVFSRNLFQSFSCAFEGLIYTLKTQRNMRIHVYLASGIILIGLILGLSAIELAVLCCVISFVLISEVINTTLEINLDFFNSKKFNPTIKLIKDIFAGVVLIASINAVIVGCIIFLPHLVNMR